MPLQMRVIGEAANSSQQQQLLAAPLLTHYPPPLLLKRTLSTSKINDFRKVSKAKAALCQRFNHQKPPKKQQNNQVPRAILRP